MMSDRSVHGFGSRQSDPLGSEVNGLEPRVPDRILSQAQCVDLTQRIEKMTSGVGVTSFKINSIYQANVRWARNSISTGGDTQSTEVTVNRDVLGAWASGTINDLNDEALRTLVRRVEAYSLLTRQDPEKYPTQYEPRHIWQAHPISSPKIWFDETYDLDAKARVDIVAPLMAKVESRGLLSAGYFQIEAQGASVIEYHSQVLRYYPRTRAQYSVTVRDPKRGGSGWAGVDFNDWTRIDMETLTAIAIDKCERSRDPVAIEPGRFTAILEPQAVSDLIGTALFYNSVPFSRITAEQLGQGPFIKRPEGGTMMGLRVLDHRLSIVADPMDPDCGFLPFDWLGEPYLPVAWVKNGILENMSHDRWYGLSHLNRDSALPDSLAFRVRWDGPVTSIDEMIATTQRGILVTRFGKIDPVDTNSAQVAGVTRDGLWLIERGKITKAIKNFRFLESPLFILNNVDQAGEAVRTFRPQAPAVCPAIKVNDFYFNGLMDAV